MIGSPIARVCKRLPTSWGRSAEPGWKPLRKRAGTSTPIPHCEQTMSVNAPAFHAPPAPPSLPLLLAQRFLAFFSRISTTIRQFWEFAAAMLGIFVPGIHRKKKLKPWMKVRRGKAREGDRELVANEADVRRLLERMRELDDARCLSE